MGRYSNEDKIKWLNLLEISGKDRRNPDHAVLEVSQMKGAPPQRTLRKWWNGEQVHPKLVEDARHSRKPGIKASLVELLDVQIQRAAKLTPESKDLRTITISIGILVDKILLLGGDPNKIVGTTNLDRVRDLVQEGKVTQSQVKERWPSLAAELFGNAVESPTGDESDSK